MKRICIIIGIVILIFCVSGTIYYVIEASANSRKIFGIDEKDYQVLKKKNTLSLFEYSGEYQLNLKIKEEQMEEFKLKIEKAGFHLLIDDVIKERGDETYYETVIKNVSGKNMEEFDKVYEYSGKVKRNVKGAHWLYKHSITAWVFCVKCKDGDYEVYMIYEEA